MKYILRAASHLHCLCDDPSYGLDPQLIPEGAKVEYVQLYSFGEKKVKYKQWVIEISTLEELHNLAKWAQFHYGANGYNESLIIQYDSQWEYPCICIYNDYFE